MPTTEEMAALQTALGDDETRVLMESFRNLRKRERRNAARGALGMEPLAMPQGPNQPALREEWRSAQDQIVELEKLLSDLDKVDLENRGKVTDVLSELLKTMAAGMATVESSAVTARGGVAETLIHEVSVLTKEAADAQSRLSLKAESETSKLLAGRQAGTDGIGIRQLQSSRDAGTFNEVLKGQFVEQVEADLLKIPTVSERHAYMLRLSTNLKDTTGVDLATLAQEVAGTGQSAPAGASANRIGMALIKYSNEAVRAQQENDMELMIVHAKAVEFDKKIRTPGAQQALSMYGEVGKAYSKVVGDVLPALIDPVQYAMEHGKLGATPKERADVRRQIGRVERHQDILTAEMAQNPVTSSTDAWARSLQKPAMQRYLNERIDAGLPGDVRSAARTAERGVGALAAGKAPTPPAGDIVRGPAASPPPTTEAPAAPVSAPLPTGTVPKTGTDEASTETDGLAMRQAPLTVQGRGRLADLRVLKLLGWDDGESRA